MTINGGVRWEPYFGQYVENDAIVIFKKENFDRGITSKVFLNAPPGLLYPGDEGFPDGKTGLNTQWGNVAPRVGVAWDVHGDGPDPLFNGNSSAWWEGDTLIIDTVGFDERTWISGNGWYHSDKLRVIERLRRPSKNYLEYQFTVEDPDVLTKPWTSGWRRTMTACSRTTAPTSRTASSSGSWRIRKSPGGNS